jgi:hypothetical protein
VLLSTLIAAALLADPPATGDAKPGAPAAPAPVKADKPKVVCHTEAVTGSLMPKRTCYTEEQSAQRRQEERQNLERIQQAPH